MVIPSVYWYTRTQPQFEFGGLVKCQILSLQLDFVAKMASSHDGTCPSSLLQGIIAGTSSLVRVCANLKMKREVPMFIKK